jgi:hypothetical protein
MSLAEFYIDNGIDPSDPNHIEHRRSLRAGGGYYNSRYDFDDVDNDKENGGGEYRPD